MFCPLIKQMNDPMEGSHRESEMFRKSRFYETKLAEVLEAKAKLGVASFSEVFDHEPMWAHYASNFTGICVAYSFRKLLKQLPDEYEFIRMTYSEKPPVLLRSKKSPDEMAKLALSTKNSALDERAGMAVNRPLKREGNVQDRQLCRTRLLGLPDRGRASQKAAPGAKGHRDLCFRDGDQQVCDLVQGAASHDDEQYLKAKSV